VGVIFLLWRTGYFLLGGSGRTNISLCFSVIMYHST